MLKLLTVIAIVLATVFNLSYNAHAQEVENESAIKRLKSIMVKNVKYDKESLTKVLADLEAMLAKAQEGTEASHEALKINFKNLENALKQTQSKVTLDLSNLSLYDALKTIGATNGLNVKIKEKEIVFDETDDLTAW